MPYTFSSRTPRSSSARSTSGGHEEPAVKPARIGSSAPVRSAAAQQRGSAVQDARAVLDQRARQRLERGGRVDEHGVRAAHQAA